MDTQKILDNLRKNNMVAVYTETAAQAVEYIKTQLPKGAFVTGGGSVSVVQSGVKELLENGDYTFLNRNRSDISKDEQMEIYKKTVGIDAYFGSANALTENGEIINVDGFSNRVSAMAFGPKKVYLIVGKNKIVPDLKAGFLRVKKIAAPLNAKRLCLDTPCAKLGKCVSLVNNENPDIADGCASENRICCDYLVLARQRVKDRITVILVNEDLGY